MKTVGIIGGLGPETTSEFYLEIIFTAYKKNQTQRPGILIWNVPLLYEIEQDLIKEAKGEERYLPYLIDAAKKLENSGVDFIVMPCNSLHIFIEEIRRSVNVPVLSILEKTAKFLKQNSIKEVGIIATSATINNKLYEKHLIEAGIKQVVPDGLQQAKIGEIINNLVLNKHMNDDREEIIKIIDSFSENDIKTVILACTDLQLLIPQHGNIKIFDTMKIFADATVEYLLE